MKLKSFFIAAIALIGFAGNVLAQRDITSQYITNATLSNGTNGWTVNNFNAPQRGNNTVGYASECYAGWGSLEKTAYSLKQTITLPKGNYRLVNYAFYREGEGANDNPTTSRAFLKAGNQSVAIKTLGSISGNNGFADTQAEGANCFDSKMYRNVVEFSIASDNTPIEIGLEGTFTVYRSWVICGMFELFDLDDLASVSSPTDVTYAITNSGFEYRNLTGWTNNITKGNNTYGNNNNFSSKAGIGFYESWQASGNGGLGNAGTFTQTLANMPAGLYELSVYAQNIEQYNNNAGGTGMFLTANNDQTEIGANGQYKVRTTLQTDGNLTIGIKLVNCTGNWIAIDRFGLQFYGDPDSALRDLLEGYIAEAEALLASSDANLLNMSQKAALQQAINDAKAATTNLSEKVDDIYNAIQTARQQIQEVKDNRAQMVAALERFENNYNLADGTDYSRLTMSAEAWTDLLSAVNNVTTALDDVSQAANYGTLKDALVAQMDATDASLRLFKSYKAMVEGTTALGIVGSYAAASNMNSDAAQEAAIAGLNSSFNIYATTLAKDFSANVFLGSNLDFSAAAGDVINSENSNTIQNVTGWDVYYADADTWSVIRTDQADNSEKLYMRKNWGSSPTTLKVFKEKMLPVGKYRLSLSWNSDLANMTNLSAYVINGTSTTIGKNSNGKLTYDFEITGTAQPFDLVIGFQKKNSGNSPAQIIVDDIVLTYLQSSLLLANNSDNSSAIASAASKTDRAFNVTLQGRTLYKDGEWNTLCLPFDYALTGTPLAGCTLMELDTEGLHAGKQTGFESETGTLYLYFKEADAITAGKPYLIKWENGENLVNPVFTGVTINGTVNNVETAYVDFMGSYSPVAFTANDKTILFLGTGNKLQWPNADMTLQSCRCYFQLKGIEVGDITQSRLFFNDEETTGIDGPTPDPSRMGREEIYDLQGRMVGNRSEVIGNRSEFGIQNSELKRGLYIVNGKKVVVK